MAFSFTLFYNSRVKNSRCLSLTSALLLTGLLPLTGCSRDPNGSSSEPEDFYGASANGIFHSFFIFSYNSNQGSIDDEITSFLDKMDDLADPYNAVSGKSNLYTINNTHLPVKVDEDLFDLVKTSLELEEKTEGYFNPLIGAISLEWKEILQSQEEVLETDIKALEGRLPALLEQMNASKLVLNEEDHSIQRVGDAKIDLGGLVKGYCVERVQQMVLNCGATRYLINGGTSSLSLGKTKGGESYRVSLRDSKTPKENYFSLHDVDTSTSGIYEQMIRVGETTYSHVINPKTGMAVSPFSMALLVGQDSALLDAFSTSCMIAGKEKAKEWSQAYSFSYSLYEDDGGYTKLVEESPDLTKARISA